MNMRNLIIAIDFDGTIHDGTGFNIGNPLPGAIPTIQRLRKRGHKIIIWTCRSGKQLDEAVHWLLRHSVPYDAVNANLPERIKAFRGDTRKVSADLYVDDKGLGMRKVKPAELWDMVRKEVNRLSLE